MLAPVTADLSFGSLPRSEVSLEIPDRGLCSCPRRHHTRGPPHVWPFAVICLGMSAPADSLADIPVRSTSAPHRLRPGCGARNAKPATRAAGRPNNLPQESPRQGTLASLVREYRPWCSRWVPVLTGGCPRRLNDQLSERHGGVEADKRIQEVAEMPAWGAYTYASSTAGTFSIRHR